MRALPGFWTPAKKAEAREVASRIGNRWRAVAAELSVRWQQPVSDESVRMALMPRRNRGERMMPPPGHMGEASAAPAVPELQRIVAPQATGPVDDVAHGERLVAIVSDVHVPEHDRAFWRVFLAVLRDVKPTDVVLAGDFGEYASATRHGGNWGVLLTEDFASVKAAFNEVEEAAPQAKKHYRAGNHETRLERRIAESMPAFRDAVTIQSGLDLDDRGVRWIPESPAPTVFGHLKILHGHEFLGDRFAPKYHAARAVDLYGNVAGDVVVFGHTHKIQCVTRAVQGGVSRGVGLGCGRTFAPYWLHGREAGWAHQFALATVLPDGAAHVQTVDVIDGRAVVNGRVYSGR